MGWADSNLFRQNFFIKIEHKLGKELSMTITVGDIYTAFPSFKPEDMLKLCDGNKNLNGRTKVSLSNIAAFGNDELSVFVAKREGKTYTNLLSKDKRTELNQEAGIVDKNQDKTAASDSKQSARAIPMNTSVFDIAPKKNQYV